MRIEGKFLLIKTNGWDYDIPLSDLSTMRGLNEWLEHMKEKTWFDRYMFKEMINLCESYFNYKFDGKTQYD